jgi:hypothetical protein
MLPRMSRRRILFAAVLLFASLLCVGFARQTQPARPRWEYTVACGRAALDRLGEEGWELSAATQDGNVTCLYFKRQK